MIRLAKSSDVDEIVKMGEIFFSEAGWNDITKWNGEKAKKSIAQFIENDNCVILVAEEDDKICGMIGAFASDIWFADDSLWQELFWYVKPKHRNGVGRQLLSALEKEFEKRHIKIGSMFTVDKINGMDRYFKRMGYRASEHTYIRRF